MMKANQTQSSRYSNLGILWVLATEMGWIAGMGIAALLGEVINPLTGGLLRIVSWAILGMLVGIVIGLGQWYLVKNTGLGGGRPTSSRWTMSTILGWGIGIGLVIGLGAGEILGWALSGLVLGLAISTVQALLVRFTLQDALRWIAAGAVGWSAGLGTIDLINMNLGFILAGVIAGSITAIGWLWGLRTAGQDVGSSPKSD